MLSLTDTNPHFLTVFVTSEKTLTDEFEKRRVELQELYRVWHVESDEAKGYYVPQELLMNLLDMRFGSKAKKKNKVEGSPSSSSSSSTAVAPASSASSTVPSTPSPPAPPAAPDQITCKHGKLCPKAVLRSKRVSKVKNAVVKFSS